MEGHANLVIAIALAVGVVAQAFARHTRLPAILVLLVAGVGVGPDGETHNINADTVAAEIA